MNLILVSLLLCTGQGSTLAFDLSRESYLSTFSETSEGGYLWVRRKSATSQINSDYIEHFDDASFTVLRHAVFGIRKTSKVRIIATEHYASNWNYVNFYTLSRDGIENSLCISHRDPASVVMKVDREGFLDRVVFTDKWIGTSYRPLKYQSDPGRDKRWARVSTYVPGAKGELELRQSKWTIVNF